MTRRRIPWFRKRLGILNRDLIHQVIHRGAAKVLDHMLLIAVNEFPLLSHEGPASLVQSDNVNDERISFPVANRIAVVRGIRIFLMWASIDGYHAKVVVEFLQLYQQSGSLHELRGIGMRRRH